MERCVVFLVTLVPLAAVAADNVKDKAIEQAKGELQGKWKLVRVVYKGEEHAPLFDEFVVIDGDKWTFDVPRVSPRGCREMTCSLDPAQNPRAIDLATKPIDKKAKVFFERGIYKIDQDTLTVCTTPAREWNATQARPKEFTTSESCMIRVFKRVTQ